MGFEKGKKTILIGALLLVTSLLPACGSSSEDPKNRILSWREVTDPELRPEFYVKNLVQYEGNPRNIPYLEYLKRKRIDASSRETMNQNGLELIRLNGSEIFYLVNGNEISFENNITMPSYLYFNYGKLIVLNSGLVSRQNYGKWIVADNKICHIMKMKNKICHIIWVDKNYTSILMEEKLWDDSQDIKKHYGISKIEIFFLRYEK